MSSTSDQILTILDDHHLAAGVLRELIHKQLWPEALVSVQMLGTETSQQLSALNDIYSLIKQEKESHGPSSS